MFYGNDLLRFHDTIEWKDILANPAASSYIETEQNATLRTSKLVNVSFSYWPLTILVPVHSFRCDNFSKQVDLKIISKLFYSMKYNPI